MKAIVGLALLTCWLALRCQAGDPQHAVDRMRDDICGEWSVAGVSCGERSLDRNRFAGIRWTIKPGILEARPGQRDAVDLIGGTNMDFRFHLLERANPFDPGSNWRHAWTWSDSDPFNFDLSHGNTGEQVRLLGTLVLDGDQLVVRIGSSKDRPNTKTKDAYLVYKLVRAKPDRLTPKGK